MVKYRRRYTKIDKIGIEIEGEFSDAFYKKLLSVGVMKGDGSVEYCQDYEHPKEVSTAEYNSHPHPIAEIDNLRKILNRFNTAYKTNNYHFNKSAGMHIHVSFSPEKPPELLSTQFVNFFIDELKQKLPEVLRIREGNTYCRINDTQTEMADKNIMSKYVERYRAINFMPSLSKHGTIEFRIFPTNKPTQMFKYILFTINTIQDFLKQPISFKHTAEIEEIEPFSKEYSEHTAIHAPLNQEFNFSTI